MYYRTKYYVLIKEIHTIHRYYVRVSAKEKSMYHYAMIEYKDGEKKCASLCRASFRDCLRIVAIALNGENTAIKNAWVESSATELTEWEVEPN